MIVQLLSAAIGIWLMFAPAVLGYGGKAADSDRAAGPLAATVGIIAASEVMRPVRRANLVIGLWLVAAPFVVGFGGVALVNALACGAALAALSFVRGTVRGRYGGGWSSLWRDEGGAP